MAKIRMMLLAATVALAGPANARPAHATSGTEAYHFIPGAVPTNDKGPDGNSIFLDAPRGLILVDTGRHPEHRDALLAYARARHRPIAAIVNTHWHLDHTTGNHEILAAFPRAEVITSRAVDGQMFRQFMVASRRESEEYLASGKASETQQAEIRRGLEVMDNLAPLHAQNPVVTSGRRRIAGRQLEIHLARYAATEGDVWIYDPVSRLAIVGDLVVNIVPFMDTACPDGWRKALNEVAATAFTTLIPGHGAPMNRTQFGQWKLAYDNFVDCGHSARAVGECVAGWKSDAAPFIDAQHDRYAAQAAAYYLETRLRSSPAEQQKYCRPGEVAD